MKIVDITDKLIFAIHDNCSFQIDRKALLYGSEIVGYYMTSQERHAIYKDTIYSQMVSAAIFDLAEQSM